MASTGDSALRTFLIADIRGYSRYTEEYGDEAAAKLAAASDSSNHATGTIGATGRI